ncbi:hypothetical protein [Polyangium sp. 6x1]|uniref:hypothetical protein n=1 Tax=Polyangium sp. 6x1 TaxID=3042689 RepID=UPI0024830803|nr:hypothetical protein [Polyangium sp. 6x1]MDI1447477.1 hypothetical protein [Polyangium sp. 6x1]
MPDVTWIRGASDTEIAERVIDPILMAALDRSKWAMLRSEERAVGVVCLLHNTACRSGLGSYIAEEPAHVQDATAGAARDLGLEDIAAGWELAIRGMDLSAWRGGIPSEVEWGHAEAREALEQALVTGAHGDMRTFLANWVRKHADAFAH